MDRRSFMGGALATPAVITASGVLMARPGLGAQDVQFLQAATVPQARVLGVHMNSAWWHSDYGCVPLWLHRMCVAAGGKSVAARGQFDDFNTAFKNPPKYDQRFPETTFPTARIGSYSTWAQHAIDRYTDVVYVPDNFQGPPNYSGAATDPNVSLPPSGGADDYVTEWTETITIREANSDDAVTHWLYEIWADGASNEGAGLLMMQENGSATPERFANWRGRTTGTFGYGAWFDQLLAGTRANLPGVAPRIRMIPVARTLVSVMENTPASALSCGDWFEDDAPHGRHHLYAVVGAICYSTMFGEVAPQPDFRGATIHPAIASNWSGIASHIFAHLEAGGFLGA